MQEKRMDSLRRITAALVVLFFSTVMAYAGTWQPLTNQPTFGAGTALLLTDGRILVQDSGNQPWWTLTPDSTGSYVNGTWTQVASTPAGYSPLYFASAVLRDGRVIVEGGEYNFGNAVWTTLGAIYDPTTNKWTSVNPPSGWNTIGDAQNVNLPNGKFLLADCCTTKAAYFNPTNLTWTAASTTGKQGINDEEGWTLLPDGSVLTVDANNPHNLTHAEKYIPQKGKWISAGSTIVQLPDTNSDNSGSHELGPAVLRPDGTVFATGAIGHNSVYTPPTDMRQPGTWTPAPDFPNITGQGQLDIADGPAALLPNGNVLCAASPGIFNIPTHFFEFNGTVLKQVPAVPRARRITSFEGRLLVLPTGQVLFTDGSSDVEVYTATGGPDPAWKPVINSVPSTLTRGSTFSISGVHLNGFSEANAYGDDASMASNYPLVRITNNATGHVVYARTHHWSSYAVANPNPVSTQVDVPASVETGASTLEVVTNGIASDPKAITVQ